jgi:uncharacterized iron-regulated protein
MKNTFLFFTILALSLTNVISQDFEADRLPIGDEIKKYDFCAVKLDKIFNTNTNAESSFDDMINELKQKRIVMIGETHTNQLHHDIQFEVVKGLVESGKPIVFALEMYNPDQDEALAAWSSGKTDANTFLEQTDFLTTWSHNYRYYKAIFDYAREKNLPIYGANVDRKYATKIGRGGLSSLTEEDKKVLPEIDISNTEHKFLIKVLMQGMDATMPEMFQNMYPAQSLWDCAMGEGAIAAAKKHPEATVIVLAGSGHVVYNLGIGRVIKDRSEFSFASVVPVDIPEDVEEEGMMKVKKNMKKEMDKKAKSKEETAGIPHGMMNKKPEQSKEKMDKPAMTHSMGMTMDDTPYRIVVRSYGDYLWGKAEMEHEKYPSFGFSLKEFDGEGFPIKRVLPETVAYENGLKTGDIILAVDGQSFENLFEIKKHLHFKNWEEEISFKIKRDEEEQDLTFVLKPIEDED